MYTLYSDFDQDLMCIDFTFNNVVETVQCTVYIVHCTLYIICICYSMPSLQFSLHVHVIIQENVNETVHPNIVVIK